MGRFLKKFFLFVLIWIFIAISTDYLFTKHLLNSNVRELEIWEDIINDRLNAEIVILGSSRAADHYQPAIIDSISGLSSYNLGQYGKTIEDDFIRYNMLKNYSKRFPKYFVWDIYFGSFAYSSKYYDEQYTPFLLNKNIWYNVNRNSIHFSLFERYIPILRYWNKNMLYKFDYLPDPYKGFVYNRADWNPDEMRKLQDSSIVFHMEDALIKEFRSTIHKIKGNGSEVIVVFSPLYFQGQACINNLDCILDTIKTIVNDEQCFFLNYLEDSICFDSTYFKNAMHLNERGTDFFSAKFAHILDSIFLNRN